MGRRTRECYLCGTKYEYCPTCTQDRLKPTWMEEFHSDDCRLIFDICTRFNMKLISKTEAQEALKKCDLSNRENFKSYVKRDLENIFDEAPKATQNKKIDTVAQEHKVENIKTHEVVNKTEK